MLKQVDNIYHFTGSLTNVQDIIEHGFYPSYAKEHLGEKNILVAMVSFSNVLLRDVGDSEVLSYGKYALGFHRDWGIANHVNPVTYTYKDGILYDTVNAFLYGTLFLHVLERYKGEFKNMSDKKMGRFSDLIKLTNTPAEVMNILDCLSTNYDENMFNAIRQHADALYRKNAAIVALTKPYIVKDSQGKEFIAYNDREWRKLYMSLNVIVEGSATEKNPEYDHWCNTKKPHYPDPNLALKFPFDDLRVILVEKADDVIALTAHLDKKLGQDVVKKRIAAGTLIIGTQVDLIKAGL